MQVVKFEQQPIGELMNMADAFAKSGMFSDIKSAAQAIVKIQAGQEIGIPPFAAMTGIHIISGKPTIGAGIIASRVKGSGKYDYKVKEQNDMICSIDFYQGKEFIGNSTFTIQDARKAGTKNLDKFPKNMLFARAISNGVKWFCPDVFSGPVYVPEEMGEEPAQTVDTTAVVMEAPTYEERRLLIDLLRNTVLEEDTDQYKNALNSITSCGDYKTYEKIQHRLESLQKEPVNKNQKDINKDLRRVQGAEA
jgi:hypothetical protein